MRLRTLSLVISLFFTVAVGAQDDALRARVKSSVAVVIGTVAAPLRFIPYRHPGSEQRPDWWEIPVKVEATLAGEKQPEFIHVAFSYNRDTYWDTSPTIEPGEKAIFLLHRYDRKETEERIHHHFAIPPIDAFVLIDRLDMQPVTNQNKIAALFK